MMRTNELQRYFDKYIDRDAIGERIDGLQDRLGKLRDLLPYRHRRRRSGYTLPAALVLGGIAALGAIAIGSVVLRRQLTNGHNPRQRQES